MTLNILINRVKAQIYGIWDLFSVISCIFHSDPDNLISFR